MAQDKIITETNGVISTTETRESRRNRVEELFKRIAFIAEACGKDIKTRDKLHKPLAEELWTISQEQLRLGELDQNFTGE